MLVAGVALVPALVPALVLSVPGVVHLEPPVDMRTPEAANFLAITS